MVIVTADLDYPRLLAQMGALEPGVVLFRGGNYSEDEVKERLAAALQAVSTEELISSVVVVEKTRIRKRRLPLE
jgi:predicted nuclease of predicted toxin-antitoxin system